MKLLRAFLWDVDGKIQVSAAVEVPGIGVVEFKQALSDDTCDLVRIEVINALRVKFGQKLKDDPPIAVDV